MPCREFVDGYGAGWTVWSVAPLSAERRRTSERRDLHRPAGRALLGRGRERRGAPAAPLTKRPLRLAVLPALLRGWLCFESDLEKRRLAPVPPGWQSMSDRGLAELCARATVVARTARRAVGSPSAPRRPHCLAIPAAGAAAPLGASTRRSSVHADS